MFLFIVARSLKDIQGCEVVIALTHMRTPNDIRLAKEVEEIDLVLGGHDHTAEFHEVSYYCAFFMAVLMNNRLQVANRYVIKSGTDFRHFSHITMRLVDGKPRIDHRLVDVTSDFGEDQQLKQKLDRFISNDANFPFCSQQMLSIPLIINRCGRREDGGSFGHLFRPSRRPLCQHSDERNKPRQFHL